jgi:phosphotriesterase-related protein
VCPPTVKGVDNEMMKLEELTGKVQTVLGLIAPDSLGLTLVHEHLLSDDSAYFVEPTDACEKKMAHEPVSLDNLYWVKLHRLQSIDDMRLKDEQLAIKEAMIFKLAGGDTIVEVTTNGSSRDPLGLVRISRATGLNIVMGAGYYVALSHPPEVVTMTEEQITEKIIRDIMVGVDDTGVRAGIIGEIGTSLPLEESEEKVLRASAAAQRQTGAPLGIHPSRSEDIVMEIIKILDDAGADLSRTIIYHADHSFPQNLTLDTCRRIMDAGCYISYDCFGHPGIFPFLDGRYIDAPSDMKRINDIIQYIEWGYLNQVLVSHDTAFKDSLTAYGGYGYAHILRNIVPILRSRDVSEEQINTILVENPKRVLPFAPPTNIDNLSS